MNYSSMYIAAWKGQFGADSSLSGQTLNYVMPKNLAIGGVKNFMRAALLPWTETPSYIGPSGS